MGAQLGSEDEITDLCSKLERERSNDVIKLCVLSSDSTYMELSFYLLKPHLQFRRHKWQQLRTTVETVG